MGRPAKPTALKLLHGDGKKNPQRINRTEPHPAAATGDAPEWLSVAAVAVWQEYAPGLLRTAVLTAADVETFAAWCDAVARRREAVAALDADGPVVEQPIVDRNGDVVGTKLVKSPWTLVLKEADAQMVHWGSRFGMTPSDRAKISVGGGERGAQTDDLFAGGA